ncbi:MAG TPA: hypothetical protein VNI54_10045 [Thermoanaerobaculia bacterium]|nr:hypothetical protein [Thermoanaerobaculia bacterium]
MSISALLLAAALSIHPDANLRLYNPHAEAVDAAISCDGVSRTVRVAPHDVVDAGRCASAAIDSAVPLDAIETLAGDGAETQRIVVPNATCETFAVEAPLFACARATATVEAPYMAGASYTWTVTGATIVSGDGTNRLILTLGDGPSAQVRASITGECTSAAEAVIAIRSPLVIEKLEVPAVSPVSTPITVTWSYAAGAVPASQLLTGDAFDAPVTLAADARSYTFTPAIAGMNKVELQASYAPSIVTKAPARRRASGKSRATATPCPSAHASAQIDVRGCTIRNLLVRVPKTVEAGDTFLASVTLRTGESATWSVTQGTIVSGGTTDTVTVKAAETGDVVLRVSVDAGPDCIMTERAEVAIVPRAVCSTAAPTAAVSLEKMGCNVATVKATFTGTPPFTGMWSDGKTLQTSERSLTRDFNGPGLYTIVNFRDSLCAGSVTENARVAVFPPHVTLTASGNCPGSTVTATFVGTPPFEGRWSDGQSFLTQSTTLTRTAQNSLRIEWYQDAACSTLREPTPRIEIAEPPSAFISTSGICSTIPTAWIPVRINAGDIGTYSVYWSDGAVTTETYSGSGSASYFFVVRQFEMKSYDQTVKITKVTTPTCQATLGTSEVKVSYRTPPQLDSAKSNVRGCLGETLQMVLKPVHPDATILWTVPAGTRILSGQGTPEITYVHDRRPATDVTVAFTYPEGHCNSSSAKFSTFADVPGRITNFSADRTTIKPGESVNVTLEIDDEIRSLGVQVHPKPLNNSFPLTEGKCTDLYGRKCTYRWTAPTTYTGPVAMVVSAGNDCGSTEAEIRLEVKP